MRVRCTRVAGHAPRLSALTRVAASEGVEGDPAAVAASVESALKEEYGSAASKDYKAKFRQLSFNLKDPKNRDLRRSVLSGEVEPRELLKMDAEELGSAERRVANQKIREHAMWECQRGQQQLVRARVRARGVWRAGTGSERVTRRCGLRAAACVLRCGARLLPRPWRQTGGQLRTRWRSESAPCDPRSRAARRRPTSSSAASASSASARTSRCRRAPRTSP